MNTAPNCVRALKGRAASNGSNLLLKSGRAGLGILIFQNTCLNGFSSYSPAGCNDAEVSEPPSGTIAAGTYIIALTQWDNGMLGNLSDGFFYVDLIPDPNFTAENGCDGTGYFCDPGTMTYDSSNWALTIQLSNPDLPALGSASEEGLSPIPEPSSALLVMGGLAAAWYMRSRKRRA